MQEFPIKEKWVARMFATFCEYADVPEDEWKKAQNKQHCLKIKKNDFFVKAGDQPDKLAYIVEGIFRVFYLSESGKESTLAFRDEGRLLSAYNSFLENSQAMFSFQALTDSILIYTSIDDSAGFLAGHPCWKTIMAKYSQMLYIEKEKRLIEFLSDDAETRYMTFMNQFPTLIKRISQYHIASYLGITPEALSRIRKKTELI